MSPPPAPVSSRTGGGGIGPPGMDGDPGDEGPQGAPGLPGPPGLNGAQGNAGTPGLDGADGDAGEMGLPGPIGQTGSPGAPGQTGGLGPPGMDGEVGESGEMGVPGPRGYTGATGSTGPIGPAGPPGPPGLDGDDPEPPLMIPGPPGNGVAWTTVSVDLGSGRMSGTFDVTGLGGLTAGKPVNVMQTAGAIASKGNARDEFEMDPIIATGYVVDPSTIRVYWSAPMIVVGTYEFAYRVSA